MLSPFDFLDRNLKHKILPDTIEAYSNLLREKIIPLKDTGTNSRVFNLWKRENLVNPPLNREHIKLSFTEFIWLKIIQDLRKFGCTLEDIESTKKLCDGLDIANLEKKLSEEEEFLSGMMDMVRHGSSGNQKDLNMLQMQKLITKLKLDAVAKPLNNLETFILHMLTTKSNPCLLLFVNENLKETENESSQDKRKGAAMLLPYFYEEDFGDIETIERINQMPHLRIPLKYYVKDFISDENNAKHLEKIELLTKDELTLLTQLRKGNATEITIKIRDGKPDRMEVTEDIKKDVEARLIETFTSHEYSDVTYKVTDGKMINFKKTTKIKLNEKK